MKKGIASPVQVVVIGGGPAGSTAACLLAQQGCSVRLFEREKFPRFHIGESLMPETYWTFKRLGMLEKLRSSDFVKKFSVQFVNEEGRESQPFYFDERDPRPCSQTWQVSRSEFDEMMLNNAAEYGADVRIGVRVLDVLFEGTRAVGVRIKDENGAEYQVAADVIVDASGQSSMIANRLKLREPDPLLKKGSIWTYYRNAYRDDGRNAGATMVLSTKDKKGWFWYIPLADDITSVGVVSDFDRLFKGRGDGEKVFQEELEECPGAKTRLTSGERVGGFYSTKDFSYRSKAISGDGWVLVGDAFGFLDPIYSSGVFLALKSGEWAADAVAAGLAEGDTSADQLGEWGPRFLQGMDRMKRLVYAFYEGFSFGQFIRRNPHLQGYVVDLLVGKLFSDDVDEVVQPMEEMLREMRVAMKTPVQP